MPSKPGIVRQAKRLAKLPNPQKRIEAGDRLCALLDKATKRMCEIEALIIEDLTKE